MSDAERYRELLRLSDLQLEMKNEIIVILHELKERYYDENQRLKRMNDNYEGLLKSMGFLRKMKEEVK